MQEEAKKLNARSIVVAALVVEGFLVCLFFMWRAVRGYEDRALAQGSDIVFGVLFALLLLAVNVVVMRCFSETRFYRRHFDLVDQLMKPLADSLGLFPALLVSLSAGVGEELFFRAVLQTEFGIVVASIVFSLVHFGLAAKRYYVLVIVYAVIGVYFGLLFWAFASVWVPLIAHFVYDFLALCYLRYCYDVYTNRE